MARAPKPPRLRPDAPPRSYERSARMELLMSPELKAQIRAAAAADGRTALPWVLDAIRSALPPELTLDDGKDGQQPQEDARMAG